MKSFKLQMNRSGTATFVPSCAVPLKMPRLCEQVKSTRTPQRIICSVSAPPPPARHAFDNRKMPYDGTGKAKESARESAIGPRSIESRSELDAAVLSKRHKLTVLKVYSRGCRSCKRVERAYAKLCQQYQQDVLCLQLLSECNQELAQSLGVRGFPTFIFFRDGKRVDHFASSSGDAVEEAIIDNL